MGSATATRGQARAITPGSGTGTRASTRSSGAASIPPAPRASSRSLLAGGSEDGFIGHTIFWDGHVDWQRRWTYNVTSKTARQHLHDPTAAARLGLADRRRRPGRRAADRRPPSLARGEPGPGRRRPALDRPARRVGTRLLAEVRRGLGPARPRAAALPLPDRQEPAPGLGRATRGRRAVARCSARWSPTCSGASHGSPRGSPRSPRGSSSASGTSGAASSSTSHAGSSARGPDRPGRRRSPDPHLDLVGAGPPGAPRPARGDRPTARRGAPARSAPILAALPAHLRLRRRSRPSSHASGSGHCVASTGAARPGSTRPG